MTPAGRGGRRRADRAGRALRRRGAAGHARAATTSSTSPPCRSTRARPTRTSRVDINMVGNHNVIAAAADDGVRRLVFASSASVYGDPRALPMSEDGPLHPLTPYCIGKLAGEDLLRLLRAPEGPVLDRAAVLQRLRARPEDQRLLHLGDQPLRQAARGPASRRSSTARASSRWTSSTCTTSPGRSCWRWTSERDNLPINIGTGIDTTVAELAEILIEAVGADVEPHLQPPRRPGEPPRRRHHPAPAEVLGWEPTHRRSGQGMADLVAGPAVSDPDPARAAAEPVQPPRLGGRRARRSARAPGSAPSP